MPKITIDFSKGDDTPNGELLLVIEKLEEKQSSTGNAMLNVQLRVLEDPQGLFLERKIFAFWMLETNAVYKTRQAIRAFVGEQPKKKVSFDFKDLIGKSAWCSVAVKKGEGEYEGTEQPDIKKYGITPKSLKNVDTGAFS